MRKFKSYVANKLFSLINKVLSKSGLELSKKLNGNMAKRLRQTGGYISLLLPDEYLQSSTSQAGQDLLVVKLLGENRNTGYFVEFGAVDGVVNSNTYYLEKKLGWNGIVSEPAKKWHAELKRNRSCHVETRCVFSNSGEHVSFGETRFWPGGNTVLGFAKDDGEERKFSKTYEVETISLGDLLDSANAPFDIDFVSIDTEGSEFEILRNFDFTSRNLRILVIEHNFVQNKRQAINQLLTNNGYKLLPLDDEISGVDDWYAKHDIHERCISLFS